MNKEKLANVVKNTKAAMSKHSPEILTGIGIAGMLTTTVLAVKATPKATMLLADAEYEKGDKLTAPEKIKTCWKCYVPAVVTATVSTGCLIGASSVNARRNAALATAYQLSSTALAEYKEKVIETIGEKKEQAVRDKIAKDKVEKNPVGKNEVIITEKGNTLCMDAISGRYFRSDIDKIKKVVNELNRRMVTGEEYISLTDFYWELGIQPTALSDELGWNVGEGLIEVDFSSQIAEDGTPCIVVDYLIEPRYDFSKLS